ncbi:MAG: hypothetical protein IT545_16305 [Rhodobacteraceae bacterium]|nr:hypothetical protein [Paracoccaceae bacterium]
MRAKGLSMIVVTMAMLPAALAEARSICTLRNLAGPWVIAAGDTRCLIRISASGTASGTCVEDGVRSDFSGRVSIDPECAFRVLVGRRQVGEGRAWSTASDGRLDAVVGIIDDLAGDDPELFGGYRRPPGGMPIL